MNWFNKNWNRVDLPKTVLLSAMLVLSALESDAQCLETIINNTWQNWKALKGTTVSYTKPSWLNLNFIGDKFTVSQSWDVYTITANELWEWWLTRFFIGWAPAWCEVNTAISREIVETLPIKLKEFIATCEQKGDKVRLEWKTASENNNGWFVIQKSSDGLNWKDIAFVEGAWTSNTEKAYKYVDMQWVDWIDYYRLVDKPTDGSTPDTSKIVTVEDCSENNFLPINVTPSIGDIGQMNIQIPGDDATVYHLHIIDAVTSRLVGTQKVRGNTSVNMSALGINIPQGMYLIKVEGLPHVAKILVTK